MIKHILKIIQAQFRSNLWILAELMVVFVALWVMTDYYITQRTLFNRPVGFNTDRVYKVALSIKSEDSPSFIVYPKESEEPKQNFDIIVDRIRRHPDVEAVGLSMYSLPYISSMSVRGLRKDSIEYWNVRQYNVNPDYFRVFDIHTANGGSPDELASLIEKPGLIISSNLAEDFFNRTVGER